jgi:hypothetical protein
MLTSTTKAEYPVPELLVLLASPLPSAATIHDESGRDLKTLEAPAGERLVNVAVAPETQRPQVAIGLTGQPLVNRVMQVNPLEGSARSAPAREAREVLTLPLSPLRRLEVLAIFRGVPGH